MSPTIETIDGLKLVINTREQGHLGRPHCHAKKAGAEASIDLETFEVLESNGFSQPALNTIVRLVAQRQEHLLAKWKEYHGEENED